jgi:tetratricopeptide (TPR) repeat protein
MPESVQQARRGEGAYLLGQRLVLAEAKRSELEKYFDQALATDPDNLHLRHHIYGHYLETGLTLIEQGNWGRAETFLRRSVEIWPNDAEARYRLGFAYMKLGRGEEALREYEASLNLQPERLSLRHSLADTYLINKMTVEAIGHFRIILKSHPEDVKALRGMGEALFLVQNLEEALIYSQKAYELAPERPEVIDTYAWTVYSSGKQELARDIVNRGKNYYESSVSMKDRREIILQK